MGCGDAKLGDHCSSLAPKGGKELRLADGLTAGGGFSAIICPAEWDSVRQNRAGELRKLTDTTLLRSLANGLWRRKVGFTLPLALPEMQR